MNFSGQLEKIAAAHPKQIILREKDMDESGYARLLSACNDICQSYQVPLFAHTFINAAKTCGIHKIHLPLPLLQTLGHRPQGFETVGTSIHSASEAVTAQALGADYITAGHVFETDCKAGLPGRGLDFIKAVAHHVTIPVYAIGGITPENMPDVLAAGAAGGCMMSSLMKSGCPKALIQGGPSHDFL